MRAAGLAALAILLAAGGCSRGKPEPPAPRGSAVLASEPTAATTVPAKAAKGAKSAAGKSAKVAKPAASASVDAGASADAKIVQLEELKLEEPEANPYSESVTLKLSVTPPVKAVVLHGAKQLAHLEPGKMDAEITRPRGSGPVDIEVKAEGYLPYHTRLYADRNDKLTVRLSRPEDAPNIFGYSRSAEGKKAAEERAQRK